MSPVQTPSRKLDLNEPFRHYAAEWREARTDTPDLMRVFSDAEAAAAYSEIDRATREALDDLSEASLRAVAGAVEE